LPLGFKKGFNVTEGIRSVEVDEAEDGTIKSVRLVFGPHYFANLEASEDGPVRFMLGATHHGFVADASAVGGELERFVYEIRDAHPESAVD